MFTLLILTWRLRYSFKNRGQQNKSHLILKYRFQAHAAELVFFSAFYSIFLIKTTILNDSCPSTFIPWLSGCSDLSCLEREEVFVLPGRMNGLGRRVDEGSRNMKRLWLFPCETHFQNPFSWTCLARNLCFVTGKFEISRHACRFQLRKFQNVSQKCMTAD